MRSQQAQEKGLLHQAQSSCTGCRSGTGVITEPALDASEELHVHIVIPPPTGEGGELKSRERPMIKSLALLFM